MTILPKASLLSALAVFMLGACSNPRSTPVPSELDDITSIQPQIQKLSDAEQKLFAGYVMRHTIAGAFGGPGIPSGVTVGKAIDEQREFQAKAEQEAAEERRRVLEAAEKRKQWTAQMNGFVAVRLENLALRDGDEYGISKEIVIAIALDNKSDKAIVGVKGRAVFRDIFGDTIQALRVSYDDGIPARGSRKWRGSKSYNQYSDDDVKLGHATLDRVQFSFDPDVIVFSDGSKLEAPEA